MANPALPARNSIVLGMFSLIFAPSLLYLEGLESCLFDPLPRISRIAFKNCKAEWAILWLSQVLKESCGKMHTPSALRPGFAEAV
jgi:hypothetical protein